MLLPLKVTVPPEEFTDVRPVMLMDRKKMATSVPGTFSRPTLNDTAPRNAAASAVNVNVGPIVGFPEPV